MTGECGVLQSLDMRQLCFWSVGSGCETAKISTKHKSFDAKNIRANALRCFAMSRHEHSSQHTFTLDYCNLILQRCGNGGGKALQHLFIPLLSFGFINKVKKKRLEWFSSCAVDSPIILEHCVIKYSANLLIPVYNLYCKRSFSLRDSDFIFNSIRIYANCLPAANLHN